MNLEITRNRTFKGVTFHLEDGDKVPLDGIDFFMIVSLGDGFDPEMQLDSLTTTGSRLIKRDSGVEIYITAEDTAKLDMDMEYEVGMKSGQDVETLFVGNITVKDGNKV